MDINSQPVVLAELHERLRTLFAVRPDGVPFVNGARELEFEDIATVIDIAHGAGVGRIGVITDKYGAGRISLVHEAQRRSMDVVSGVPAAAQSWLYPVWPDRELRTNFNSPRPCCRSVNFGRAGAMEIPARSAGAGQPRYRVEAVPALVLR